MKPRIEIRYCTGCRWLTRAAWIAQELLTTFESELGGVALVPSDEGGTFDLLADGELAPNAIIDLIAPFRPAVRAPAPPPEPEPEPTPAS